MSELERLEQGLEARQWVALSPEAAAAPIDQLPPLLPPLRTSTPGPGGS